MGTNVKSISHVSQIVASAKSLEYKYEIHRIAPIRKVSFHLHGVRGCYCGHEKGKLGLLVLNRYTEWYYTVCLRCHFHAFQVQNFIWIEE